MPRPTSAADRFPGEMEDRKTGSPTTAASSIRLFREEKAQGARAKLAPTRLLHV